MTEIPSPNPSMMGNAQKNENKDITSPKPKTLAGYYRWLMLGGGFFQVILGVGILLVVNLLVLEQISLAYPYVTPTLITILEVYGIAGMAIPGCLLVVGGFWAGRLAKLAPEDVARGKSYKAIRIIIYIGAITGLVGIPVGTAVGITLIREMGMLTTPA